jgi:hypothetical protein
LGRQVEQDSALVADEINFCQQVKIWQVQRKTKDKGTEQQLLTQSLIKPTSVMKKRPLTSA